MNDTKLKGNLTEMQCMLAFMKLGYQISIPFGEDCRYDFIVDINNHLYRIQCKTSSEFTDATGEIAGITFKTCRQTGSNARTSIRTKYTKEDIDYFATFYKDNCYLVPVEESSVEKRLRIIPPKNGTKMQNNIKDYELCEVLKTL